MLEERERELVRRVLDGESAAVIARAFDIPVAHIEAMFRAVLRRVAGPD